jgi:hypothetical protein
MPGLFNRAVQRCFQTSDVAKGDLAPSDNKELMNRLSEDITKKMNLAMADVFKQYLG